MHIAHTEEEIEINANQAGQANQASSNQANQATVAQLTCRLI